MTESTSSPEILPPASATAGADRWNRGAWLFRDSTLRALEILLDEAFVLPGTGLRFGINGIIGLVPGLGDFLSGLLTLIIPLAAWIRGVPYVTLLRMATNIGISVGIGSIPVVGDFFDVAWKPNRRNYRLLMRHIGQPRRHTWRDWGFLLLLSSPLGLIFALPFALALWLAFWLFHHL